MPKSINLDRLRPEDFPSLRRVFTCSNVREFLGGPIDVDAAEQRTEQWIARSANSPLWAIRRCCDSRFLGYVLLDRHHDSNDTEISYALLIDYWGKGYATVAVEEGLFRAASECGLTEVVAETQAKNERSIRLLERVGMTEERRLMRFGEEQVVFRISLRKDPDH